MIEPTPDMSNDELSLLDMTTQIVAAAVAGTSVAQVVDHVGAMIAAVHDGLRATRAPIAPPAPAEVVHEPAVPIRSSVKSDYIVCLEDGKKLKMLKRYLRTQFDMSPDEYIAKWKLPRDYPMVAPSYSETRRALAKASGLGTKEARGEPRLPM